MSTTRKKEPGPWVRVLPEFVPLETLWSGQRAMFESENQVRWFMRSRRAALVKAQAVAITHGRTLVHPQRLASVMEADALALAARRLADA